ncbi:MAG: protein kinase, partial [Acidobacteriota bacterium]
MDPDRWQQVQALFDQALPLPENERRAFLEDACQGDVELLQEVRTLLTADEDGAGFFEEALQEGLDLFQSAQESPATPTHFGKYEVVGEVGEGGFGKVYRGRDPQLERAVAIKTCATRDPLLRQRFAREARIAARLQHPKIVTVHDFGEEAGLPFLVQELLAGEDLDRHSARGEVLSLESKVDVLLQIAQGMAYAHHQGVLHRDIKPGNIRLLADDQIKIMDFGIACLLHEEQRLTGEHMTVGTIGYIAPEQLTGSPLDERSDVFSFGVLAYELLAGERPFQGEIYAEVSDQILHHEPPPLRRLARRIPGALADCIQRCLAKEPDARPAGFAKIVDWLEAVVAKGGASARAWRWGGIAAGLALATLVTAWVLRPDPPLPRGETMPPSSHEAAGSPAGAPTEATSGVGVESPSSSAAGPVQATASQPRPTPSVADPGSSEDPIVSGPVTEPPDESPNAPADESPTPQSTTGTQARQDPADRPQDAPARTEPFRTDLAHADTTQADEPTTPDEADRIAQQNPSPPDGGSPEAPITEP